MNTPLPSDEEFYAAVVAAMLRGECFIEEDPGVYGRAVRHMDPRFPGNRDQAYYCWTDRELWCALQGDFVGWGQARRASTEPCNMLRRLGVESHWYLL